MKYGLLGAKLDHSYSQVIHGLLGNQDYQLCPLTPAAFDQLMRERRFCGVNITIPFKRRVLAYCDVLDDIVRRTGAVNTVMNVSNKLVAYNTDYAGMAYALERRGILPAGKTVMILGNGGTAATARALMQDLGAKQIMIVSRSNKSEILNAESQVDKTCKRYIRTKMDIDTPIVLTYKQVAERHDVQLIINTTPVGMYPENGKEPIALDAFPHLEAVMDAIYNPLKTMLLQEAEQRDVVAENGLRMLVAQAAMSAQRFGLLDNGVELVPGVWRKLMEKCCNIVLVGMPGAGKSTLGKALAQRIHRPFWDIDSMVERSAGTSIEAVFAEKGEAYFRALEVEAAAEAGRQNGAVIATGGGTVLNDENVRTLKQNGIIVYLRRPLETLEISPKRPLARDRTALSRLADTRLPRYEAVADVVVDALQDTEKTLRRIEQAVAGHIDALQ